MTDVVKLADSPALKIIIGFIQAVLVAAAIGAVNSITSSLESIKGQLSAFSTTVALQGQDIDGLKRSRDVLQKQVDDLRLQSQRHEFQLGMIQESRTSTRVPSQAIARAEREWEPKQ